MKIKGAELIEFMNTGWPGGEDDMDWYWDHDLFEQPDPTATYDTEDIGPLYYQGKGKDPTDGNGRDLARLIRAWRKKRTTDLFVVRVPKGKEDELKAFLKTIKGSIEK